MKPVAVLGGGPAGAFAAAQLASAGLDVTVFDEKLAWEKPCGGGLTHKAYARYPFLAGGAAKKSISRTVLRAPRAGEVRLDLDKPILIYSRLDLNRMLLDRAAKAGARIEKTRVLAIERASSGWRIRTRHGIADAGFCILTTGARNPLREFGTALRPADTMTALGYYVPGESDEIDIQFLGGIEGYIWTFPRCGHLAVGICGKGVPAAVLRTRLEDYLTGRGIRWKGCSFYSHLLPALDACSWKRNRVSGESWLAAGDAAGLVDPVTGEGLYYALRSAELAAASVLNGSPATYAASLRSDFSLDLERASELASQIYLGRFLFRPIPDRIVQFTRRSPRFRALMQDLFAGAQNYLGLDARLYRGLPRTLFEIYRSYV
jgi:flavin-dependent dehydrogenase